MAGREHLMSWTGTSGRTTSQGSPPGPNVTTICSILSLLNACYGRTSYALGIKANASKHCGSEREIFVSRVPQNDRPYIGVPGQSVLKAKVWHFSNMPGIRYRI